jgi:D-alanyl-lipoteichoic acid acyltransferase DltB (MBOAT superfamily)
MSLSRWLQDYLYIPLGGSRGSRWQTYRNLLITMLLGGFWHGANWTFLIWGGWHGGGLAVERWMETRVLWHWKMPHWLRRVCTFHFVVFGWLWFRAKDTAEALGLFRQMWFGFAAETPGSGEAFPVMGLSLIMLGLLMNWLPPLEHWQWRPLAPEKKIKIVFGWSLVAGLALAFIVWVRPTGMAPFIYFHF